MELMHPLKRSEKDWVIAPPNMDENDHIHWKIIDRDPSIDAELTTEFIRHFCKDIQDRLSRVEVWQNLSRIFLERASGPHSSILRMFWDGVLL